MSDKLTPEEAREELKEIYGHPPYPDWEPEDEQIDAIISRIQCENCEKLNIENERLNKWCDGLRKNNKAAHFTLGVLDKTNIALRKKLDLTILELASYKPIAKGE